MNVALWIAIALVCFVLPTTALTGGGKKVPERNELHQYARHVGLPLPEHLIPAVNARLLRRQRGMMIGGLVGIAIGVLIYLMFFSTDDGAVAALIVPAAGMGTAFGGAWAIAAHRPGTMPNRPVIARMRSVSLTDYVTRGERFGFWMSPVVLILGTLAGIVLLKLVPQAHSAPAILAGVVPTVLALVTWGVSLLTLRSVLAAPARSESEPELAWDDAERADGLRQVANLSVAVAGIAQVLWLNSIGQALLQDGAYQEAPAAANILTVTSLTIFGTLICIVAAGPVTSWVTGTRKGYEQRQLWPHGVTP